MIEAALAHTGAPQCRSTVRALQVLLGQVGTTGGRLTVVRGGIASGKTTTFGDFVRLADADDTVIVLAATAAEDEQCLQAGVVEQLFRGAAGLASEPAERVTGLIAAVQGGTGPAAPGSDVRTHKELYQALLAHADGRTILIAVDDVHFADEFSNTSCTTSCAGSDPRGRCSC